VRSGRARAEIRHYLRTMKRQESVDLGSRLLAQAAAQLNLRIADASPETWSELVREAQARDRDELLADVGLGRRLAAVLARQLVRLQTRSGPAGAEAPAREGAAAVVAPLQIQGTEGMALQMANCCAPIPGDDIVGQMRRDLGLVVHQSDCPHAQRARRADPERWLDLQWADEPGGVYSVNMDVRASNERGVLGYVAVAVAEAESNILSVNIEDDDSREVTIHFKIQVHDRRHLARVMRSLRRIRQVLRVSRTRTASRHQSAEAPPEAPAQELP
jgi:(p)ppGpp synthase/HD superfamily hydrolase